jgi:hypothetical protein
MKAVSRCFGICDTSKNCSGLLLERFEPFFDKLSIIEILEQVSGRLKAL